MKQNKSNTIFIGRDYIVMPSDASAKLSPLAFDVLGTIVSTIFNHPNHSFNIGNIIHKYPLNYQYQVKCSLNELLHYRYLLYKNGKWIVNQEI